MSQSFAWQTQNTKEAACLGVLDLPIKTQRSIESTSGREITQFFVGPRSVRRNPPYFRDAVLQAWKKGDLEKNEPLHPFLQGCRVEHNYELLLDAQKRGRRIRLVGVGPKSGSAAFATEYRDGEEALELVNEPLIFRLADLSLVAALGTLGIPCVNIEFNGKHHIYTLPVEGHLLRQRDGSLGRYNGVNLCQRQEGKRDLDLELRDPSHPLVSAYGTRQIHGQLLRHIKDERRLMLVRAPGTQRMAIVSDNPTGRVMDILEDHFRL